MRISFGRMEIHNFMSYADEVVNLDKQRGMNLICGVNNDIPGSNNACGKSSLCHALVYAIYGKMPFELNRDNMINRYVGSKDMYVSVALSTSNRRYVITSGVRNKHAYCTLMDMTGGSEKDITKSTIQETRNFIVSEIVRCEMGMFMRTIMLNSDQSYNFYNLSKSDKNVFINKLFDIERLSEMYSHSHPMKLRVERSISSENSKMMVYAKNKEDYERVSKEWYSKNESDIDSLKRYLVELKAERESVVSSPSVNNEKKIEKCNELRKSQEKIRGESSVAIRNSTFTIKSIKDTISTLERQIGKFSDIVSKHSVVMDKLCDGCRTVFAKHYKIDQYVSEIEKMKSKISENRDRGSRLAEEIRRLRDSISTNDSNISKIDAKIRELSRDFEERKSKMLKIDTCISNTISKIEELNASKNPYVGMMEVNERNMSETAAELERLHTEYDELDMLELVIGQESIKRIIIHDMVGELNNSISCYLHKMGANYDVVFDDDMNYRFVTSVPGKPEFHNFSSGEQMRLSIATCFAFRDFLSRRSNIMSNILILDEFIDSNIDTMAIDSIIDILEGFSKTNGQNVFVISHRNEVKEDTRFNRIIEISKTNNVSTLKYIQNR